LGGQGADEHGWLTGSPRYQLYQCLKRANLPQASTSNTAREAYNAILEKGKELVLDEAEQGSKESRMSVLLASLQSSIRTKTISKEVHGVEGTRYFLLL
jgi:hypothetical protein